MGYQSGVFHRVYPKVAAIRRVTFGIVCLLVPVALCSWRVSAFAQNNSPVENTVERTVEFRNGSVLRVHIPDQEVPWRRIFPDGRLVSQPVKLSQVGKLRLVKVPATEQVAAIRRLVVQLGDSDYQTREQAQRALTAQGGKFQKILEPALNATKDAEVLWRLSEVIRSLPRDQKDVNTDYDLLTLTSGNDQLQGDVGNWTLKFEYRGQQISIDRSNVLAISDQPLEFHKNTLTPIIRVDPIKEDKNEHFPANTRWINFERGPQGEKLIPGRDIGKTFVPLGCMLESSFSDAFISVQTYNVGGRSGGNSAATHDPLYQGAIVIRFCAPGNMQIPGGVRTVGFWTSHIAPEGTALEAYDAHDRKIAEVKTTTTGREFLALRSNTPIAYVKIVPDPDIDPDYAIDDLRFDEPFPLAEMGAPGLYSLLLTSGERLQGAALDVNHDAVALLKATIGPPRLVIQRSQVAAVIPPRKPKFPGDANEGCFARMADGSVLKVRGKAGLAPVRFPKLKVDPANLVALWGAKSPQLPPRTEDWPTDKSIALLNTGKRGYLQLPQWRLGAAGLESPALQDDTPRLRYEDASSPAVWFRASKPRPAQSGLIRLVSREQIVLGGSSAGGFTLKSWNAEGVTLTRDDRQWTIGFNEIHSLVLPDAAR